MSTSCAPDEARLRTSHCTPVEPTGRFPVTLAFFVDGETPTTWKYVTGFDFPVRVGFPEASNAPTETAPVS